MTENETPYILWFKNCSYKNKHLVGGKCSSLGELSVLSQKIGFNIADGFALTTFFYDEYLKYNGLDETIQMMIETLDVENIETLDSECEKIKLLYSADPSSRDAIMHAIGYKIVNSERILLSNPLDILSLICCTASFANTKITLPFCCGGLAMKWRVQRPTGTFLTYGKK